MAVTSVAVKEESLTVTTAGRVYVDTYLVVANAQLSAHEAAVADDGVTAIPLIGAAHADNADATATRRRVYTEADPQGATIWNVAVTYETPTGSNTHAADPTDEAAQISIGTRFMSRAVLFDNGKAEKKAQAILNSAREPYATPPESDFATTEISIVRNETGFDPEDARKYKGAVNTGALDIAGYTIGIRQGRCMRYDGVSRERNGIVYTEVTYVISLYQGPWGEVYADKSVLGWDLQLLDEGLNQVCATGTKRCLDGEKQEVTEPVRLNGNGYQLDAKLDATKSIFQTFRVFPEVDFGPLNLPTAWPA